MQIVLENLRPSRTAHLWLLPNINRSDKDLADAVTIQVLDPANMLDKERPTRKLSDKEIYSVIVDVSSDELAAHDKVMLEVNFEPKLFQLLNHSGIVIDNKSLPIDLKQAKKDSTKSGRIQLFLEALTFWGTPSLEKATNQSVGFRIFDETGNSLLEQSRWSGADLRTADLILVGDDAPPERIFMCELDDNGPSVRELSAGAKSAGVPLTIVPVEVGMGDSWLQDQFQLGYTATPEGLQRVIVHLPRMKHDSALVPGTPNLRNFVDGYFPSKDIGVVKDFWKIPLKITDGTAATLEYDVAQSYPTYRQFLRVVTLFRRMMHVIRKYDKHFKLPFEIKGLLDLYRVRIAIELCRFKLLSLKNVKTDELEKMQQLAKAAEDLKKFMAINYDRVEFDLKLGET